MISCITTYYNHIHATVFYDLFCNNKSKKVNYLKLIWVYSPRKWHSKQLKFASPYVACDDLSVWEGKLNQAPTLHTWSCLACSAVLWFSMSGAISVLRNKEHKFAISKAQCLHAMCVCLNLYVHDHIRCIVKVCVSQLFWCREVTHNTEVAALRYEAIFAPQYFITSQRATRLSFTCYNRANFLCFSLLWGGKKASL